MTHYEDNDDVFDYHNVGSSMISNCCGAPPLGELDNVPDGCDPTGICSRCRDHAGFEQECED